ncbi:hypothetical protein LguiB_002955 [Lonicera macranthoides]
MNNLLQISVNFNTPHVGLNQGQSCSLKLPKPFSSYPFSTTGICSFHQNGHGFGSCKGRLQLLEVGVGKKGILFDGLKDKKKRRKVLVKFNLGPGRNGGGGSGGGGGDGNTARVLGNLALAVGLTYLSFTGQLGWVLDAIVSVWLLVVILPILGLGAFFWWAGRDIVEGSCPNCGKDFQILKSALNDDLQLCPFCSQPFSVVDDEFIPDPVKFYNQPNSFDQTFPDLSEFSRRSKQGKGKSKAIVDVEAEVKDAD